MIFYSNIKTIVIYCYYKMDGFLQVAGEQEMNGQVKLMLKDISGHRIVATRSLVSTQKVILFNERAGNIV
jgi:hypothetical protein